MNYAFHLIGLLEARALEIECSNIDLGIPIRGYLKRSLAYKTRDIYHKSEGRDFVKYDQMSNFANERSKHWWEELIKIDDQLGCVLHWCKGDRFDLIWQVWNAIEDRFPRVLEIEIENQRENISSGVKIKCEQVRANYLLTKETLSKAGYNHPQTKPTIQQEADDPRLHLVGPWIQKINRFQEDVRVLNSFYRNFPELRDNIKNLIQDVRHKKNEIDQIVCPVELSVEVINSRMVAGRRCFELFTKLKNSGYRCFDNQDWPPSE